MSTRSKLDPVAKQRKAARVALLRNPPKFKNADSHWAAAAILGELNLIHLSPYLDGDTKHKLFERGAKQLSELK